MNLYFRLIRILVKALFTTPTQNIHQEFSCDFRVWPNDLDINMHMNNGRYLTILDLARIDMMAQMGLLFPVLRKGWLPVLGATQMSFFRPLNPFRKFTVVTRLEHWDDRWFIITQRFVCEGKTAAVGRIRGLFRGREGTIPTQAVLSVTNNASATEHTPVLSQELADWLKSLDSMKRLRD